MFGSYFLIKNEQYSQQLMEHVTDVIDLHK